MERRCCLREGLFVLYPDKPRLWPPSLRMEPPFLLQALRTAQKSPLTLPTQKSQAFLSSAESCRLQQPRKKKGHFSPRVSHTSGFVDTQNFFFCGHCGHWQAPGYCRQFVEVLLRLQVKESAACKLTNRAGVRKMSDRKALWDSVRTDNCRSGMIWCRY